jgi:cupin 2 domain-containing protein
MEERHERLYECAGVRVEKITSTGYVSPEGEWFDQVEDEWVMVLEGEGVLECEDGAIIEMKPGSHIALPAGLKHRIARTSTRPPCVWLAVYHLKP